MKILDTRDLNERLEELEGELDSLWTAYREALEAFDNIEDGLAEGVVDPDDDPDAKEGWSEVNAAALAELEKVDENLSYKLLTAGEALEEFIINEGQELKDLQDLKDGLDGWQDGVALIPEDDFEEYAQDLAADLHGSAVRDSAWPFSHIDWASAAADLAMDYTSVKFQGESYLYRS